ncbi:MAG: hypothetical protein UV38_C0003G0124 [candidate division TM6 bacterium GW2011_GWE2_42_60]|nr:MAG: hypothetical protein UV38_C0003G0124 [candidate division TM6 bacterium GW2011_GWE2_42_60]HBY05397.1 hypothetical protein [Candidatus Dependentiae bacterium]
MQINFKKIALASAFMSVLTPLFCAPSARVSLPFNYAQQQEQKKNLFASTLAAAKKFVASKTRLQLALATGWLAFMGVTVVSMGLLLAGIYYTKSDKESDRQFGSNLAEIAVWPITIPENLFLHLYYGEFKTEGTEYKKATYSDLSKGIDNHNFVDENFEVKIEELSKNPTDFNFSIKTNKYGKQSYCFTRKGSNQSKTAVSQEQKDKTKLNNVNIVNTILYNKKYAEITPDDTLRALKTLLKKPNIHTIIVNKSGFSYWKNRHVKAIIRTKREFSKDPGRPSEPFSIFENSHSPIKIEFADSTLKRI